MKTLRIAALALLGAWLASQAPAKAPEFNVAWSHYTGWEPWDYAEHSGILKKWAGKYGISIKLTRVNDYVESINLYTARKFDACTMTNMDALTIPAVGGLDSTSLIVGDFSNGNDGILLKKGKTVADLKGQTVRLVELSVSHYLLSRALSMNKLTEGDLKLKNTSDAEMGAAFAADPKGACVTWNPILMQAAKGSGVSLAFDSSKIPGEIVDLMVVRTDAPEALKKALVGAWYETMKLMNGKGALTDKALGEMAAGAGGSLADFKAQLTSTAMFYKPEMGVAFSRGEALKKTMDYVRSFSFEKGLYGKGAKSKDLVGIEFPDGSVLGDKANVKLRFDAKYMKMAADGKL